MRYVTCELCGKRFCCNNYADRKARVKRYQGKICCAYCQFHALPVIRKLIDEKILKLGKKAIKK